MKKEAKKKCTLFEEMLMWTSYRYCIGRHTYVISMAHDIAEHYYDKLSDERLEFTARDIRREINDQMRFLPVRFGTENIYGEPDLDYLELFLEFVKKENITTTKELSWYKSIMYVKNLETKECRFEVFKEEPTINKYFSRGDIDDLIPWMNLANLFDKKNYKKVTLKDGTSYICFKSWVKKCIPIENEPMRYRMCEFGWEPVWIEINDYLKSEYCKYAPEDSIKKIESI